MITESLNIFPATFCATLSGQSCPECSAEMMEVDRRNENQALYVWYECSRNNCDGQWLQKMPVSILKQYLEGLTNDCTEY